MKFNQFSIPGPKGENQDELLAPFKVGDATWCAIADGVGSAEQGGLAARGCLQELARQISDGIRSMPELFSQVAKHLNELAATNERPKAFSTTLSVLCINGNKARVGHVGDTRISHYRGQGVMARTKDQTEVQKLLDDGAISKNQARRYPRRNVLLSAMSAGREYDLFQTEFAVQSADRILLTSDGFHTKLMRRKISEISCINPDFDKFCQEIEKLILSEILSDDASCIAIEI